MRLYTPLLVAVIAAGCSGNPTSQTPVVVPPAPSTSSSLTGHVVATNGGDSLSGVDVSVAGASAVTIGNGSFSVSVTPSSVGTLTLSGNNIVTRVVRVRLDHGRDMQFDAINVNTPFSLAFFRQFARNGFESPGSLDVIRRISVPTVNILLNTTDDAGKSIDERTLTLVENTARDITPIWSAGNVAVGTIERGNGTRSGWITVTWPTTLSIPGKCGVAPIGSQGIIEFQSHNVSCSGPQSLIAAIIVRHELGHVLGFRHTDSQSDVMWGGTWSNANLSPSARERYHAAIAYARTFGNTDPDSDPAGAAPLSVEEHRIAD